MKLSTIYDNSPFSLLTSGQQKGLIGRIANWDFISLFYKYFKIDENFIARGRIGFAASTGITQLEDIRPFGISKSAPGTGKTTVSTSPDSLK
jgi:hypothetical protein